MSETRVAGKFRLRWSLLCILALLTVDAAHAIIIRHDRSYASYRVRESDFPAIFFLERQGSRKVCVATLIDPQWALTAAHCASETGLQQTLNSEHRFVVEVAGRQRQIRQLVLHPRYQPDSPAEVDLALLQFAEPLDYPGPIALNVDPGESGRTVSLLGWGFFGIGTTGRQYDDGLFRMAHNRIELADRRLLIRFDDPRDPESGALDLEGMPGLGDSGGPALLRQDDRWLLAGIAVGEIMGASFSEETQGSYGAIAVYERVSRHLEWIRRTISEDHSLASE
ncbi:MAG: trypsin-like serine protease [Gammaproteobacteria bacterium]|nr:trypsin-like serine protease [Pseudomonadales bacterium]MCP5349140.1 trypsin-like serine protease [Pseudomonadales bacterium]